MTQGLSIKYRDSSGDCQANIPAFNFHNSLHMRNLVMRLQGELEWHRHFAATQVCDGVIDFLRILFHEFVRIQDHFSNEQEMQDNLSSTVHRIDAVINQLSSMRREFRPAVLDELGLVSAIESEITRLCHNADIACRTYIKDKNLRFNDNFETILFRVIEQGLSNIEKHACASEIVFAYGISDGNELILEVRDNGRGISEEQLYDPSSVGLISMREQIANIGGEIDIVPMMEAGTLIFINIPESVWRARISCVDPVN